MGPMRWLIILAGLAAIFLQVGCGATPQSLGITGPGPVLQPALRPSDATVPNPGLPDPGTSSGAEQRYYRYN